LSDLSYVSYKNNKKEVTAWIKESRFL
jgi:hypothetical protein